MGVVMRGSARNKERSAGGIIEISQIRSAVQRPQGRRGCRASTHANTVGHARDRRRLRGYLRQSVLARAETDIVIGGIFGSIRSPSSLPDPVPPRRCLRLKFASVHCSPAYGTANRATTGTARDKKICSPSADFPFESTEEAGRSDLNQ